MNYIRHMNAWYSKVYEDKRMKSTHIALYTALFQFWNLNRFDNPVTVFRSELMRLSKIGSANTYTKCLKELDEWSYIQYLPSHNPMQGSRVHLYTFDKSGDKTTDQSPVTVVRPYIKQNKQMKQVKSDVNQIKNYDEPL
ncbi:MAG: hypothetical protein ABJG78_12685 [Cyclobacteriaceae bacterium]